MKFLCLLLMFPASAFSCEQCIEELVKQNKEILVEIIHCESHQSYHEACIFYYYCGRAESLTDAIKILKQNH